MSQRIEKLWNEFTNLEYIKQADGKLSQSQFERYVRIVRNLVALGQLGMFWLKEIQNA